MDSRSILVDKVHCGHHSVGMVNELEEDLEHGKRLIADTLDRARTELSELEGRKTYLLAVIARAEAMHDALNADDQPGRQMTLHEAIAFLIEETSNRWMTVKELADAINRRGLYHKKDGSPVEINQIHARINNYGHLFEKEGARVRLHAATEGAGNLDQLVSG